MKLTDPKFAELERKLATLRLWAGHAAHPLAGLIRGPQAEAATGRGNGDESMTAYMAVIFLIARSLGGSKKFGISEES